jgi:hypothetical protein
METIFKLVGKENGIVVEVNGSGEDLFNMFASTLDQNPQLKTLFEMALLSLEMSKRMNQSSKNENDGLSDMLGQLGVSLN